jgi:hypothetical protein
VPISDKNARAVITISKELKAALEEIAERENRSLSGQIVYILKEYIREKAGSQ